MFKKGLNYKLQAELACKAVDLSYNDFITLAIKIDNLMRNSQRSCRSISSSLEQAQKYLDSQEPMQIASTCLSSTERGRCQREKLCYYCGDENHHNATRPHKAKKPPRKPAQCEYH